MKQEVDISYRATYITEVVNPGKWIGLWGNGNLKTQDYDATSVKEAYEKAEQFKKEFNAKDNAIVYKLTGLQKIITEDLPLPK